MNLNGQAPRTGQRIENIIVCVAALACALALTYEFSPGFMSPDSLYQYRQAMGLAPLNDAHPVIMAMLWRALAHMSSSTGMMLLFHQLFYWGAILLLTIVLTQRLVYRLVLLLAIGFCPPLVITSLHIWKDVGMMCALALSCAALLGFIRYGHWTWLLVTALALFYAIAVRINGFIPALFLLFCLGYLAARHLKLSTMRKAALIPLTMIVLSMAYFYGLAAINAKAEKSYGLGTLLVWDLAEISLAKGEDVIPPYILRVSTGPVLEDLARVRLREANFPFWAVVWPFPPKEYEARLLPDWLSVVAANPGPYLRHRAHVFLVMLGVGVEKIYYPYHAKVDGNEFGFKLNHITQERADSYTRGFERLASTVFYKPWLYLLLCIVALATACRRLRHKSGDRDEQVLAAMVASSGIANAGSLFFLATAADYRYMIWTVFAGVISTALVGARLLRTHSAVSPIARRIPSV